MPERRRILVVDYGGVLGEHHQPAPENQLAEIFRTDVITLRKLLSENSEQGCAVREARITESEFWDTVANIAGIRPDSRPPDATLSTLWAETYKFDAEVYSKLLELKPFAHIGILTNIDKGRSDYLLNTVQVLSKVDFYFPSYEFGYIKPKLEIWEKVTERIGKSLGESAEIFYLDDRQRHVDAAAFFGWTGIVYHGIDTFDQLFECLS